MQQLVIQARLKAARGRDLNIGNITFYRGCQKTRLERIYVKEVASCGCVAEVAEVSDHYLVRVALNWVSGTIFGPGVWILNPKLFQ